MCTCIVYSTCTCNIEVAGHEGCMLSRSPWKMTIERHIRPMRRACTPQDSGRGFKINLPDAAPPLHFVHPLLRVKRCP